MADVSILDLISGSSDVPPEVLAPKGDYQLRIKGAYFNFNDESGNKGILLNLQFTEYPNYSEFMDFLNLPMPDDTEANRNKKLRRIDEFKKAFSAPPNLDPNLGEFYKLGSKEEVKAFNEGKLSALEGLTGWATVEQASDEKRGMQNKIKGSPFNTGGYLVKR